MIPFDFEYYRPDSVRQAVEWFLRLQAQGKKPIYFSGGTEVITRARRNDVRPGAVIDLKAIPECGTLQYLNDDLVIGSCVTLSALSAANPFPLLSLTAQGVADQTARNQITLGGNVCGFIHYREAVLPLLLSNCRVLLAGADGVREAFIRDVFEQKMRLKNSEFVVQFKVEREYLTLPYVHYKKRQIGNVGYPLVVLAAIKKDGRIRTAYSGVCDFPFQSDEIDRELNEANVPLTDRIERAVSRLPAPVSTNVEGSVAYREYVLKLTMADTVSLLEGR